MGRGTAEAISGEQKTKSFRWKSDSKATARLWAIDCKVDFNEGSLISRMAFR